MWIKLSAREENWRAIGDGEKQTVSVLIQSETILAMKGIPFADGEENKTLIFVKATNSDGWLEFSVVETIEEIHAIIGG